MTPEQIADAILVYCREHKCTVDEAFAAVRRLGAYSSNNNWLIEHWQARALKAEASLAQASQARTDGGAVAWMDDEGRVLSREQMNNAMNHQGGPGRIVAAKYSTPLFPPGNATQAAGAREPLTDEWIRDAFMTTNIRPWDATFSCFRDGIRFAERAHGIASPASELKKD